mmetsp:Transcript_5284/g.8868  ORF Transcript_5284/g.8868 Transcript_5284/m.8868 type:complete len:348 (+) Transcript_5284:158-1201(+)
MGGSVRTKVSNLSVAVGAGHARMEDPTAGRSLACVAQYDDRPTVPQTVLHTRRACELEPGCVYFGLGDLPRLGLNSTVLPTWPVYWRKVAFAALLLRSGQCALLISLDADAVMGAAGTSWFQLELSTRPHAAMLLSGDPPCWPSQNRFCAGVFALVASPLGLEIMSTWLAAYPERHWHQSSGGSWVCTSGHHRKPCVWAGPEYEQQAFVDSVMVVPRYRDAILHVPACQLNTACASRAEAAARSVGACHFMGVSKYHVAEGYLRSFEDGVQTGDTITSDTFCSPNATFRQFGRTRTCRLHDMRTRGSLFANLDPGSARRSNNSMNLGSNTSSNSSSSQSNGFLRQMN